MPDYQKELVEYRLQTAEGKLHSAKILALDKVDFSKHTGVIAYFQKEYIKTGKFDKEYSKYISSAFQIRNNCDYADFVRPKRVVFLNCCMKQPPHRFGVFLAVGAS